MYDDDFDDYLLDDYNDQLNDLEDQEQFAYDMYESEVNEIDEYWNRENEYIKNSGIYTDVLRRWGLVLVSYYYRPCKSRLQGRRLYRVS